MVRRLAEMQPICFLNAPLASRAAAAIGLSGLRCCVSAKPSEIGRTTGSSLRSLKASSVAGFRQKATIRASKQRNTEKFNYEVRPRSPDAPIGALEGGSLYPKKTLILKKVHLPAALDPGAADGIVPHDPPGIQHRLPALESAVIVKVQALASKATIRKNQSAPILKPASNKFPSIIANHRALRRDCVHDRPLLRRLGKGACQGATPDTYISPMRLLSGGSQSAASHPVIFG